MSIKDEVKETTTKSIHEIKTAILSIVDNMEKEYFLDDGIETIYYIRLLRETIHRLSKDT